MICIGGCTSKNQETENYITNEIISYDTYEDLSKYKEYYLSEGSEVVHLVKLLPIEYYIESVYTSRSGGTYDIKVYYIIDDQGDSLWTDETLEKKILFNATMLFTIINNVDEIAFNITGEKKADYVLTREDVEALYPFKLQEFLDDKDVWINKLIEPIIEGAYVIPEEK